MRLGPVRESVYARLLTVFERGYGEAVQLFVPFRSSHGSDGTAFCIVGYSCVVFIAFLEVLFTCSL